MEFGTAPALFFRAMSPLYVDFLIIFLKYLSKKGGL